MLMEKEPPHPGIILQREFIEPNGIAPHRLAKDLGWKYEDLEQFINGEINLSIKSAFDLAEILDMDPGFWLKLQTDWREWHENQLINSNLENENTQQDSD